jgi:molybdopterin synthase sulfur carrier subunit
MLQIQCFGIIKDLVGDSSIHVQESPHTVGELRTLLTKKYPSFNTISSWMIAVNQSYAEDHTSLAANDEVALIPPVSGG